MLYIKYRPHSLAALDNSAVIETLQALLHKKEIPHALLFVGQKGTGKTSTARIVAKAINCQNNVFNKKGTAVEPCNACENCRAIDSGSFPDVMEMDAASNRGIDQMRQITQEAAFSPIAGRFRVYIVDEAHMITTEGFNALLKTLEEPPRTVVFILATTNEEKVPKTIASRCIRLNFGKAKKEDILHMLKKVAKGEKIELPEETAKLIVTHADSSFRDAVKILEELQMMKAFALSDAERYLGTRVRNNLLEIISKKPLTGALEWSQHYFSQGGSVKILLTNILNQLHELLLIRYKLIDDEMKEITLTNSDIIRLMKLATEAYGLSRFSPVESIPLEIMITEFYNQKK